MSYDLNDPVAVFQQEIINKQAEYPSGKVLQDLSSRCLIRAFEQRYMYN
jgi:hypothetical protein